MKWFYWVLAIALVLIGLDYMLGDGDEKQPVTNDPLAASLYEDGLQDLFAFRFEPAISKLERALELDPSFAEAGIALAGAYGRLGRAPEMEAALARADSLTELIPDPKRRMLAQLRICRNPMSTSHGFRDSLLQRLRKEEPDNIFVLRALAEGAAEDRRLEEAERLWRRILEIDPNYADSYNRLGYLELGRANYEQAIDHMQKYAFLSPGMANPHDSLGDVYRVTGRYDEAEAEYELALKLQPEFYFSLINLGRIHLRRGQIKSGVELLERVGREMAGTKYEQDTDELILSAYLNAGLDEQLARTARRYIAKYPDSINAVLYRSMMLAERGEKQASRAVVDSLVTECRTGDEYKKSVQARFKTESFSLLYEALMADIHLNAAVRERAWRKNVDFVAEKVPFHDQWFYRKMLAQAQYDGGKPEQALSTLRPMLAVNPNLFYMLELAVKSSLELQDAETARRLFDQLRWSLEQADPDLPVVQRLPALEARVIELEAGS